MASMQSKNSLTSCPAKFSQRSTVKSFVPYTASKKGAQNNVATPGVFDLDVDSNGRWSVEKFGSSSKSSDANAIAQETRRGKGNFLIVR